MNIYGKMATVKKLLNQAEIKKSGHNKFSGYDYYELKDFMPFLIDTCTSNNLLTKVTFTNELATLTIINVDDPTEQIEYTAPFIIPEVKGANVCQNAGAAQTYCRRYLYLAAFDIVESDAFDAVTGKKEAEAETRRRDAVAKQEAAKKAPTPKPAPAPRLAPVVQHGGYNRDAYNELLTSWKTAGREPDALDKWIQSEAVKAKLSAINSTFLKTLNERIISYMAKEVAVNGNEQ